MDCAGTVPCPVKSLGNVWTDRGYQAAVQIDELLVWTTYAYRVVVEDDYGYIAQVSGTFLTEALPKIAVNEVMANPSVSPETGGEYIELYNHGVESYDLSGYELRLDGGAEQGGKTCALVGETPWTIPAGEIWIVTSGLMPACIPASTGHVWWHWRRGVPWSIRARRSLYLTTGAESCRPLAAGLSPTKTGGASNASRPLTPTWKLTFVFPETILGHLRPRKTACRALDAIEVRSPRRISRFGGFVP